MVRTYVRKTARRVPPVGVLDAAREQVRNGTAIRTAASDYGIQFMTLWRYCHADGQDGYKTFGYKRHSQVLSDEMERQFAEYLELACKLNHGLSSIETRKLAYQFAAKNKMRMPETWTKKKIAGVDWLGGFMRRHPALSLRKPRATSLSRATAFNKENVDIFFDQLAAVMDKNQIAPQDIWNVDETGVTTVQNPQRVISPRGIRQVSSVTSAERGQLVTMTLAVNAVGNTVPPFFIFPRVHFKDHFLNGSPTGSSGSANPSGWMKAEDFLLYVHHFHAHTKSSPEKPCLLILDNHSSHLSIDVIDFCKANGIILLTIPPHCSHKMQPLDRSVYGPFKTYMNQACDGWMRDHPGRTMTIYDIPMIVKTALPSAISCRNITSGFAATGIHPFNRNCFDDEEFLGSYVTDRPYNIQAPEAAERSQDAQVSQQTSDESSGDEGARFCLFPVGGHLESRGRRRQSASRVSVGETPGTSGHTVAVSPEEIRPHPKAPPRKGTVTRRKRKLEILTDSPVKERIREEQNVKEKSKSGKNSKTKVTPKTSKRSRKPAEEGEALQLPSSDDVRCFTYGMRYAMSCESWIMCDACHRWACEPCTDAPKRGGYVCKLCR